MDLVPCAAFGTIMSITYVSRMRSMAPLFCDCYKFVIIDFLIPSIIGIDNLKLSAK
jgi:hypothetical protein